jgi:hypothetical protein
VEEVGLPPFLPISFPLTHATVGLPPATRGLFHLPLTPRTRRWRMRGCGRLLQSPFDEINAFQQAIAEKVDSMNPGYAKQLDNKFFVGFEGRCVGVLPPTFLLHTAACFALCDQPFDQPCQASRIPSALWPALWSTLWPELCPSSLASFVGSPVASFWPELRLPLEASFVARPACIQPSGKFLVRVVATLCGQPRSV